MNVYGRNWIWVVTRLGIYHRDGFACQYCGLVVGESEALSGVLSLDHVEPGGASKPPNLVTACHACNSHRGARTINPAHVARIQAQLAKPIDRTAARAIAERLIPHRLEAKRSAVRRRRTQPEEVPF